MARLKWTQTALHSLRDIHAYIARDRPTTARRTIESIINKAQSLTGAPGVGQRYTHQPDRSIHQLNYGHFRIAYEITHEQDVTVLGVFHGLIFLPLK